MIAAFRIVVLALALSLTHLIAAAITVAGFGREAFPPPLSGTLAWQAMSHLIIAAVLVWIGTRSRWSGWRTGAALAGVSFGITHFNSIIEAYFFGLFDGRGTAAALAVTVIAAGLLVPVMAVLFRQSAREDRERPSIRLTPLRMAAGAFAYLVAYFAAGILVFPFVRPFYEQRPMPGGLEVIAMQLLVRGPLFVLLAVLILRTVTTGRREAISMVAIAFSALGGIAPLIVPNTLIPDSIRWYHFVEVTTSNLAYGAFVGWLLTAKARLRSPSPAPLPRTS